MFNWMSDQDIIVSRKAESVVFRFSHGSVASSSFNAVSNSKVLRTALEIAEEDEDVFFQLPAGLLESWVLWHAVENAQGTLVAVAPLALLQCLNASDYLGDEGAVRAICPLVARWMFAGITDGGVNDEYDRHRITQVLDEVPENVIPLILQASGLSLERMIAALPSTYSSAALHAVYPEILYTPALHLQPLQCEEIGPKYVMKLWGAITQQTKLVSLNLCGNSELCCARPESAVGITRLTGLQTLSFEGSGIDAPCIHVLAPHVGKLTALRELNLKANSLNCEGSKALAPLSKLQNLKVLKLANNGIKDAGAKAVTRTLAALPQLQVLHLGGNQITIKGYRALGRQLPFMTSLQHLNLDGVALGDQGAKSLACRLSFLTGLRVLSLYSCAFKTEGFTALATQVSCLGVLEELNLGKNRITKHEASEALAASLLHASQLQVLSLESTCVTAHDIEHLCGSFHGLHSLRVLNMSNNMFSDAGVMTLAPYLSCLSQLEVLDVSRNNVYNRGLIEIADAITSLLRLRSLNLRLNSITPEGPVALIPRVRHLKGLQKVDFQYNCMTGKDASGWPSTFKVTTNPFLPPDDLLG